MSPAPATPEYISAGSHAVTLWFTRDEVGGYENVGQRFIFKRPSSREVLTLRSLLMAHYKASRLEKVTRQVSCTGQYLIRH